MNKTKFFLFCLLTALLYSCNSNKNQAEEGDQTILKKPTIELSAKDTAEIYSLSDQFMASFSKHDLASAARMLYTVEKNGKVKPYSADKQKDFVSHLDMFTLKDCRRDYIIIRSALNNEVKISWAIGPNADFERGKDVIGFVLNPVRQDGKWYLTLRDGLAEGVEDIYAPENN